LEPASPLNCIHNREDKEPGSEHRQKP
jgi:hypothetical protein